MKKLLWILVLSLFYFNIALSQSLLPKCDGSKNNVNKFSLKHPNEMGTFKKWKEYLKHYKKSRKWTNCYGIGLGPRGEKYVGEWQKGKFHGQGTFTYDGRTYVGEWKKGKKHGMGTYQYPNGDKYIGEWIKSRYGKEGIYIYSNGEKYIGEWKKKEYHLPDNQQERNGWGTYIYTNGDKYIGEWKKGEKHGKGTFTSSDGKIKKGIWKKNKFVK